MISIDELNVKINILPDDSSQAKQKFKDGVQKIANEVNSKPPKVKVDLDTANAKKVAKEWQSIFKESLTKITAPNVDLNPLKNQYKELEKLQDSFYKKNKNFNDGKIENDLNASKRYSAQLKSQMEEKKRLDGLQAKSNTRYTSLSSKFNPDLLRENADQYPTSQYGSAYRTQISKVQGMISNIDGGQTPKTTENVKLLARELEKLRTIETQMSKDNTLKNRTQQQGIDFLNLSKESDKYYEKIKKQLKNNPTLAKQYADFDKKLNDPKGFTTIKDGRQAFGELQKNMRDAGIETETLTKKLKNLFSTHLNTAIVLAGIGLLKQGLQQVVTNVVELDKSLVNLQMVTGGSRNQTSALLDTYNQMAKTMGATTVEVANSGNEFLRQGKSLEDTNTLIKNTMILSKISMLDSASATQFMTSAMKGYKVSVEDSLNVVDKVAAVDMMSATSAGGLMEGMSRVANFANTVGFSMDRLLGTLATVGEVTQRDMSSVGDSLRTTFARMSNIKLGKLIDDETGESLSDVETALDRLGIKLRINETEYRNYGDILDEVAKKWKNGEFTQVDKNTLGSAFNGTRRIEDFLVLMNNYDNVLKYTEGSLNSTGSAQKKFNEAYTQGIEAKVKTFTSTFEDLSRTFLDSGLVKVTVDSGSGILGFLTSITKLLGTIPTLAVTAGAVLSSRNLGISNVKYALPYSLSTVA